VRVAHQDVLSHVVVPDADLAAVVDEGVLQLRLDAACDAAGRIGLVHVVPVWQHAVHGTVRGMELWSAAERQGRTGALQRWLLHETCLEVASLVDHGIDVAVSLPAGMVHPEGLAAEVAGALQASGLAASRLILSFTEETLLTSSAGLLPELEAVRATGVRLCLDNYGMGHSIFALMARVPLDLVRVDLAALAPRDEVDRALHVLAMIAGTMRNLGLLSVAGGVSTPDVRPGVVATGVDLLHGRNEPHDLTAEELAVLVAGGDPVPTA
jgi:EAL domain-containing protein (putative c-di-GMP-specific phosphodiesterase class I)